MVIKNLQDLDHRKTLALNDVVVFEIIPEIFSYKVEDGFCSRLFLSVQNNCGRHDAIFKFLGIDIRAFCAGHYGYPLREYTIPDIWPGARPGDYEALTRVVRALYKEINIRYGKFRNGDFNKFSFMDFSF